jgi:GcrA cell cycle regulator
MAWNDERVELLKKLWSDGLSASQIAGRLGGVTRNAVIGKVHRLGLSGRATTSRMKSHRPRARAQTAKRLMKPRFANVGNPALRQLYLGDTEPYTPPAEELVIPVAERKSIQTLTEASCRWPIGDPQHADFHFCGRSKITGLPYSARGQRGARGQGEGRGLRSSVSLCPTGALAKRRGEAGSRGGLPAFCFRGRRRRVWDARSEQRAIDTIWGAPHKLPHDLSDQQATPFSSPARAAAMTDR